MIYRYVAYDAERKMIEGAIEAATEAQARQALEETGQRLLVLRPGKVPTSTRRFFSSLFAVKKSDLIVFSKLLATLLERGIPLIGALQLLKEQTKSSKLREIITSVIQDLTQGDSFSVAVSKYPQAFPPVYRCMVRVAEQTGNLEVSLRQAADYIERESAAMAKVTRALVYPAFVLMVATGLIVVLLTFVLPSFMEVFAQFNAQLPLTTRLIIGTTRFFGAYKLYLLAGVVVAGALAFWYARTPRGHKTLDRLLLRVMVVGRINALREMSHFSRTVSILLEAGLPITEVLETAIQTTRNSVVSDALKEVREGMLRGRGLSRPISENKLFPPLLAQIVKVGEEAGTLGTDLKVLTDLYDQEIDQRMVALLHLMEPCMLLGLGAVVAFVALSVIMPIYTAMASVK